MTTLHTEITQTPPEGFVVNLTAKHAHYRDLYQRYEPPNNKQDAGLRYNFLNDSDQIAYDLQQAQGIAFSATSNQS